MARTGGRPRRIQESDIVGIGRELGLRALSMNAVADRLDVSTTALYRHVDGRWGLERLVGESLVGDFRLTDDSALPAARYLISFGMQLRGQVFARPGLGAYLQTLFPRGEAGRALLADAAAALERRGYARDAAIVLCSAVASIAIGYAAAEDLQRERADGLDEVRREATDEILADARIGSAHARIPAVDSEQYLRMLLAAAIGGFISAAPPGRPTAEVLAELAARGEGI